MLVGLSPRARDDAGGAVGLGARLARAWDEELAVALVVTPGTDADATPAWAAVAGVLAATGLAARRETVHGRSVAEALVAAAGAQDVTAVVLGTDADRSGRIATRVARSSPVPVVLARGGGSSVPGLPIDRVTCAFDGTAAATALLAAAADLARRSAASLRVASFAVRRGRTIPSEVGPDVEDPVLAAWSAQIAAAQREALATLGLEGAETGVHVGTGWDAAVHAASWTEADLLVVGGSPHAATRFFLGDRAGAILAAAPVPAVIVRP